MSIDKFYDSVDNCIQAIVYKFGVPDSISKHRSKINLFYGRKTGKRTRVELFTEDKMYIINVNSEKAYFSIKETEYYQNRKEMLKMKTMQKFVNFFWVDIDVNELVWYDYIKMFGFYVGVVTWITFMMIHITW